LKHPEPTRLFTTAAVLGMLAAPAAAQEGEEGIWLPGVSAKVTLDYTSQYFFRGYEQLDADQGLVLQPGAEFTLDVVDDVTATVGTWGSIHTDTDGPPGVVSNPSSWYEQDVYASLDATLGDFEAGVGLTYYTYPSSATNIDVTELNLTLAYDDSELLGDLAFNPYIEVAVELQNNAGTDENTYLELGGAFTLPTQDTAIADWSWTVPFKVGLSIDDYYNRPVTVGGDEEFFGYFQIGLAGSIPLSELIGTDEYLGAWDLGVGVYVLLLNNDVALTDNADGSSDNIQFYATVGISREW
jgi:uncharacterized protein (TIGR02001 family)